MSNKFTENILIIGDRDDIIAKANELKPDNIIYVHHTISQIGVDMVTKEARETDKVLFLEDLAEFPKAALELIRDKMLEGGFKVLSYTQKCPCGGRWFGFIDDNHVGESKGCRCSEYHKYKYNNRIPTDLKDLFKIIEL